MRIPLLNSLLKRLGVNREGAQADFEAWETKHRKTIQGDLEEIWQYLPEDLTFIDVGANVGLFSEAILNRLPKARGFLFEPVGEMHARCSQRFGDDQRVTLENFALSDEAGLATIYKARYNPGGNSLVHELMFDTRDVSEVSENPEHGEEEIKLEVFDEYAARMGLTHAHFIKTDTEGFDHRVLKGMMGFIRACDPKPVILSEFMSEEYHPFWEEQKAIIDELYSLGYQELDLSDMGKVGDYLFVPKGR
ncbi:MAG: FkbM family methyltransferase [Planctomycetota bacterium]|jgi:FkbM family methyltransferase